MSSVFVLLSAVQVGAQMVPSSFEQIDYLVTFGTESHTAWGDDDNSQVFFFVIPSSFTKPIYIRVFDPSTGSNIDERNGEWNTRTNFSVYSGAGTHSEPDSRKTDPVGNYRSGHLLASKTFSNEPKYDNRWYSFGPFNPQEGEKSEEVNGHVFKIIAEGLLGDDGNLYKYFLSTQPDVNREVEGANAFTYEYSFRLPEAIHSVAHLYPFIDKDMISLTQHNFDFDKEGTVLLYSVTKNRHKAEVSGNNTWGTSKHYIEEGERNTSMDLQIVKNKTSRNDMVCFLTNQYAEAVAFFSSPIGGPPKFKYKVNVKYKTESAK
ncbi:hypothetical protein N7E81_02950 [Reichenbachiella carrageenanivorans]|uniref:DNA/RNA non-specific endonuclease n=1 Tax=Reichenbachiella carrageenanivorans TaxID=2979869 RepID=A0ABY6D1R3_9BACT|nr:hypothetical protein [Reichenbachiella carrageenanivorans]UXX80063.1 hypothetical protein N7E81_02950 [Reichenbachiella carrageenanivorans]